MGSAGSTSNATQEDIRRVFTQGDQPSTPFTATEVAERLKCPRRTAERGLDELAERGELLTRQLDGSTRVWWATDGELSVADQSDEDEFDAFVSAVKDYAIFRLDPEGIVVSWNDGAERIKGYRRAEIIGEHFSTFYTADDVDDGVPTRNLETARADGRVEDEGWRVREDGTRFWANVTITAIRDDDGGLKGFTKVTRDLTERREYEQQLRHERDLVEQLLDTVPVAIGVLDAEGSFVRANPRMNELHGLDEADLSGFSITSVAMYDAEGEQIPMEEWPWKRAAEDGQTVRGFQCQIDYPDNDRRWVSIFAAPFVDGSAENRVVTAVEDISDQKERERQLEQRKTELETELGEIFDRISDAFYAFDADWRFTHLNEQAATIMQHPIDELLGREVWEVYPDAQEGAYWENLQTAMDTQEPVSFEVYEADVDAWLEFNVYPSESGLSIYFRDISERKARERALEQSERRYRTLVDHFPNGAVALVDEDLHYRTAGGSPIDSADVTIEELMNQPVRDVLPQELADELAPRYERALEGEPTEFELDLPHRIYQIRTVPVRNASGQVFAALGMSQDITERREYERKLEESNERLEQFAYAASHDLQEPLRMVSSYLRLLERRYADVLEDDAREFIEFAVDGADRMRDMIDGLLKYSRVETSGTPFEPVELDAVLSAVLDDLQIRIEEHDATVSVDALPRVRGDPGQLRQVFQNLLDNAIEYSGDGPPRVAISATREDERWIISVRDEGIGIDPGDTDRIFELFQRLHATDDYPGTGLGLALCERIIERHGGDIWVDSAPDEGSTFYLSFPTAPDR